MDIDNQVLTFFKLTEQEHRNLLFEKSGSFFKEYIVAGTAHIAVLNSDGTVTARGDNTYGQCNTHTWKDIIKLSAGDYHTVGLKRDGSVLAVGDNSCGQCNVSTWHSVVDVFSDRNMSAALLSDGKILVSSNAKSEDYEYEVLPDQTAKLICYNGTDEKVVIPDEIMGNLVVELGSNLFSKNDSCRLICDIVIPTSVRIIDDECFKNCKKLKSIIIPESVEILGERAFEDCVSLEAVEITAKAEIKEGVFFGCAALTRMICCDGLDIEGKNCFDVRKSIFINNKLITIEASKTEQISKETVDENEVNLESQPSIGEVNEAFPRVQQVVTLSDLTYTCFDDGTVEISKCDPNVANVMIGRRIMNLPVTRIGEEAFKDCRIEKIIVPETIISIGKAAFWGCQRLVDVTVKEGVKEIKDYAFGDCRNLETVNISESVTSIAGNAFFGCASLNNLELPDRIPRSRFSLEKTRMLVNFTYSCPTIGSIRIEKYIGHGGEVTVPLGVVEIAPHAFEGNLSLRKVSLPTDLKIIGDYAFWHCPLKNVYIPESVASIGNKSFDLSVRILCNAGSYAHDFARRNLKKYSIANRDSLKHL